MNIFSCPQCDFTETDLKIFNMHVCGNQQEKAKRDPSGVRYDILMPEFYHTMAQIANYGAIHYGDFNWCKSRLTGGKGPINHIYEHLNQYLNWEIYDHPEIGTDRRIHLAAIAFNAMMEFWYECHLEIK